MQLCQQLCQQSLLQCEYSVVKAVYCFDLMWLTFKRLLTSKKKLLCFTKPWGSLAISHAEISFFKGYNAVCTHGSLLLCWGGQETVGGSTTDLLHVANCTVWLYCFFCVLLWCSRWSEFPSGGAATISQTKTIKCLFAQHYTIYLVCIEYICIQYTSQTDDLSSWGRAWASWFKSWHTSYG